MDVTDSLLFYHSLCLFNVFPTKTTVFSYDLYTVLSSTEVKPNNMREKDGALKEDDEQSERVRGEHARGRGGKKNQRGRKEFDKQKDKKETKMNS